MNTLKHVAIIMDGNRRWAVRHGLKPSEGHRRGVEALEKTVTAAAQMKIKYLTVYALSTENLRSRQKRELSTLFSLIKQMLTERLSSLNKAGVKVEFFGDLGRLPGVVQQAAETAQNTLAKNKGLQLNIALNYGAREEIVQAAQRFSEGKGEEDFNKLLYTHQIPDPDLIIRTGGEKRLSNFLLWQAAYSELYFTDILWPDFDSEQLKKALLDYSARKRNFGA